MQDRVSATPGRMLITPENGQPAFYATVEMADNPTVLGTPLNKASLLTDATAALFGLGTDAVPDDVLATARSLITTAQSTANTANTTANSKMRVYTGSYTGDGSASARTINLGVYPVAVFVEFKNGARCSGRNDFSLGGLALRSRPLYNYGFTGSYEGITPKAVMSLASTGFKLEVNGIGNSLNMSGITYYYIAFA